MVFDHPKFAVTLNIERATRIPYSSGSVFVRWNVTDSPRPDTHGRTMSSKLHRTDAVFNQEAKFKQRIGIRNSSRYLRNCQIKFEVVWEPVNSKGVTIGTLNLDLSQFAQTKQHHDFLQSIWKSEKDDEKDVDPAEVGARAPGQSVATNGAYDRSLLYLLEDARTNCLVALKIKVDYLHGGDDYKVPSFDGPAVNYDNNVAPELSGDVDDAADPDTKKGSNKKNGRDKLRKLRADVFDDIRRSETHKTNTDSDWLDLDNFLKGNTVRIVPKEAFDELRQKGVRNADEYGAEYHKPGTPYLETEIQENFITWNIL